MAQFAELFIDQGSNFNDVIYITDDLTNLPINISGYGVTSQMKRSYYSANISANISCTVSNASNGEITLSMSPGVTANIRAGRYLYDVKTTDRANNVSRVVEGIINIMPQISR